MIRKMQPQMLSNLVGDVGERVVEEIFCKVGPAVQPRLDLPPGLSLGESMRSYFT